MAMRVRPPSGHSPRPGDTPRTKHLKDLRQKRLAFFESQQKAEGPVPTHEADM